jgi:hypothetical protein
MEQRPLRLGDIVDDYCPRERRITNHVIVALIGDVIRQTRCTTCEAEHVYKEAKVPRRRKKNEPGTLYEQVLADVAPGALVPPDEAEVDEPAMEASAPDERSEAGGVSNGAAAEAPPADSEPDTNGAPDEAWFGHRRLIRASLPKTDAEPPPRPIPEFTMHQRQTRGGQHFRHGQGGNGPGRNGFRPGRPGDGQGSGQGQGGRPPRGGRSGRHRGSNKRSR